ncbi:hypothetical protein L7F22_027811 [Adiantum nelumboides]|nr:hypothetical protein [Adiantum nelumboides]
MAFPCLSTLLLLFSFIAGAAASISGGYKVTSIAHQGNSVEALLEAISPSSSTFGPDIPLLQLHAGYVSQDIFHVHITDQAEPRWEIPYTLLPRQLTHHRSLAQLASHEFQFFYTESPFGFSITRTSTKEVLFNSTSPSSNSDSLVFKDQYLEISTSLPVASSLYGFGESTRPAGFKLVPGNIYTLWAEDVGSVNPNINLYASLPFYMDVRNDGKTHGVLLLNSNGMDVLYEGELLTYKVIGGVLDFYFFSGPSPLSVMEQFTKLVGRPAPMPYWSLGFHQCRYGYKNITDIETVVATYKAKNIPLDVMWSDIDYMDAYKDFTFDPTNYPVDQVKVFVDKLHADGQKYVIIIDPGIKYETNYSTFQHGIEKDVFIKDVNGDNYLGQVWPGPVHYPDFLHPNAGSYWTKEISDFHDIVPFDGLWIDMNEPSNFCTGISCKLPTDASCPNLEEQTTCCLVCSDANMTQWDDPPYKINSSNGQRPLRNKTIATSATHFGGILEYDAHNLYGFAEAIVTNRALRRTLGKRPFVLSRSTFIGSGAYTAHWTGDNGATWNDLAYSIVGVLNSGLVGIPMVGADICGFSGDTWEELCNRWIQVGAFYPFSRDHSAIDSKRQELYLWDSVTASAKKVLSLRYQLLPFIYTLVFEAHKSGAPIARPLFFHFNDDPSVYTIDKQFLLGQSVLVSPVLTPNTTAVKAYIPAGTWYNLFDYSQVIVNGDKGSHHTLAAPMDTINVHVHEGSILPLQEAALTTVAARKTPFTLIIAFSMKQGGEDAEKAEGALFLDNGEDIMMGLEPGKSTFVKFKASRSEGNYEVESVVKEGSFALKNGWVLQKIVVLGTDSLPRRLLVNGSKVVQTVQVNKGRHGSLEMSGLGLLIGRPFSLQWTS